MVKPDKKIDIAFNEAVKKARNTPIKLPPDTMLLLYAYYKQATQKNNILHVNDIEENDLRSAFKYNAMIQVRGLSPTEAKKKYIDLVKQYIEKTN